MIWLTSDTHFNHKNVIKYCNRPYQTVEDMNERLINNWNERVGIDDTVFHLGDFGFGNASKLADIRIRLNGRIFFVLGNHDLSISKSQWQHTVGMTGVYGSYELEEFLLYHYPKESPEGDKTKGKLQRPPIEFEGWCLTGHVHEHWRIKNKCLNVGVDVHDYRPLSLDECRKIIKQYEEVDENK